MGDYEGLSISSGGYKGLQILGALAYLDLQGYLDKIRWYSGCSIGGILNTLLAVGWKPIRLYMRAVNVALFNGMGSLNFRELKDKYGLLRNDHLRKELEQLIIEKRQGLVTDDKVIPTLLDLHNEGIYISFSIVDRRSRRSHRIDYLSHPSLSVSDAALMSANVPLLFQPINFEGMQVVDGALANPFPVEYLDRINRRNHRHGIDKRIKILGIVVYGIPDPADESFVTYVSDTISIPIEEMQRMIVKSVSHHVDILEMSVQELSLLSLHDSYTVKNKLFFAGFADAQVLVDTITGTSKSRKVKEKVPKAKVRTPVTKFPNDLLLKCLLSQPVDILAQAALTGKSSLQKCLSALNESRKERIQNLARQLIKKEVDAGVYVKMDSKPDPRYAADEPVRVRENYSQKIYDTLPLQFKAAAKVVIDSLPAEKAQETISGVNIVIEGLTRLGIDIFSGFLLTGSSTEDTVEGPNGELRDRVEIVEEPDLPARPVIEEVD